MATQTPSQLAAFDPKRREFLVRGATALAAVAAGGAAACADQHFVQQPKTTKAQAAYQPQPNGPQSCGNCANFIPPNDCRVVMGPVAPSGWSRLWQARRG